MSAVRIVPVYDVAFGEAVDVGDNIGGDDKRFHAPGSRNRSGDVIGWRVLAEDFPKRGASSAVSGRASCRELVFAPHLGGSAYRLSKKVDAISMLEAIKRAETQEREV